MTLDESIQRLPRHVDVQSLPAIDSATALPLGITSEGQPAHLDILNDSLHIGVYGTSGCGKDNLLRCWFLLMAQHNTPTDV
jgi:hypothetical protein